MLAVKRRTKPSDKSERVMTESSGSSSGISKSSVDMFFRPMLKSVFYNDQVVEIEWLYTKDVYQYDEDEIWIVPLKRENSQKFKLNSLRWREISEGSMLMSLTTSVSEIEEKTRLIPEGGALYIAEYHRKDSLDVAYAATPSFRLIKEDRPDTMILPEVFNDDGLIVLGSGSDSEPELLDVEELEEPIRGLSINEDNEGDDTIIVMPKSDLRKLEETSRANNDTLCSFIDQYKNDLLELTKCNETLKQSLADEEANSETYCAEVKRLKEERQINHRSMSSREKIFQKLYRNLGRDLEAQQKKTAKLEEQCSILGLQASDLKCVVDAQTVTKNLLLEELETLKEEKAKMCRELKDARAKLRSMADTSTDTADLPKTHDIDAAIADGVREYISTLKPEINGYCELKKENERLKIENLDLLKRLNAQTTRFSNESRVTGAAAMSPTMSPAVIDMEDRIQDLLKRLRTAKSEYITLYKENKRKEKALEDICNWASLAKNGMSMEAPIPPKLPSTTVKSPKRLFSPEDSEATESQPSLTDKSTASDTNLKLRSKDTYNSSHDENVELSSDSKLMLPPRQKRKIEHVRRIPASPMAAGPSGTSSRGTVKIVRRRHKSQDRLRSQLLQVKRDSSLLEEWSPPKASVPILNKELTELKGMPKPLVPVKVETPVASAPAIPKIQDPKAQAATNTYSAAGLLSDVESDNSDEEDKGSNLNPNICPLCVTSIMDYEAHMREAHQKQPCPICGYVFNTNVPLYVITYHIERHLEEKPDGPCPLLEPVD